jgi:hypothetical protein
MLRNCLLSVFLAAALLGFLQAPDAAGAGATGHKLPTRSLVGGATGDSIRVQMVWQYDPILFQLTSLVGRYRVVRIDISNNGQKAFELSAENDRLAAVISGREVPAILDLGASDAKAWDAIADEMRRNLAYPVKVNPGEQETVFAYLKDLPAGAEVTELRYSVASFPAAPITLRKAAAMAR